MDLITYALAKQLIAEYGSKDAQIADISTNTDGELVVTLSDGRIFKTLLPTSSAGVVTQIENIKSEVTELKSQVITEISIDDTPIAIVDGKLNLPLANCDEAGLVVAKLNNSEKNMISVNDDGYLEINSVSLNKIVQDEEEELILKCTTF